MDEIRRIFVEKKEAFAVEARGLLADLQTNLGMKGLTGIRVINRYDVMGVTDEEFAAPKRWCFPNRRLIPLKKNWKYLQAAVLLL